MVGTATRVVAGPSVWMGGDVFAPDRSLDARTPGACGNVGAKHRGAGWLLTCIKVLRDQVAAIGELMRGEALEGVEH
jgi:hypothetical protein